MQIAALLDMVRKQARPGFLRIAEHWRPTVNSQNVPCQATRLCDVTFRHARCGRSGNSDRDCFHDRRRSRQRRLDHHPASVATLRGPIARKAHIHGDFPDAGHPSRTSSSSAADSAASRPPRPSAKAPVRVTLSRQAQLPPLPAAALPGGDGLARALRYRLPDPRDPAQPAEHHRAARRGDESIDLDRQVVRLTDRELASTT